MRSLGTLGWLVEGLALTMLIAGLEGLKRELKELVKQAPLLVKMQQYVMQIIN